MPGTTYHAIYISGIGEVATLGYQGDHYPLLSSVLSGEIVARHTTVRRTRPRFSRNAYVYVERRAVAPLNPSSGVMYDRDFYGAVVIVGDDPFYGDTMLLVRDFALDAIPGAVLIPWPGHEPDEETDKYVGSRDEKRLDGEAAQVDEPGDDAGRGPHDPPCPF